MITQAHSEAEIMEGSCHGTETRVTDVLLIHTLIWSPKTFYSLSLPPLSLADGEGHPGYTFPSRTPTSPLPLNWTLLLIALVRDRRWEAVSSDSPITQPCV